MKLTAFSLLFLLSCTPQKEAPNDDYVLIEFASKLEEDQKVQQANKLDQPTQPIGRP